MYLIAVLIVVGLLQIWGAQNPLHRDDFVIRWINKSNEWAWVHKTTWLHIVLVLLLPVIAVVLAFEWLPNWMWLILATIVLLYSMGRGDFAPVLDDYAKACGDNRWDQAILKAEHQGVVVDDIEDQDWSILHQRVLESAAYQGFERMFAVVFWFLFFGPAGALLYRLSFMYVQHNPSSIAQRWLWALEWPAVRVLGVSFAVTGNFVGCINRWKKNIFSQTGESAHILGETILGALSVDDELVQSCDYTHREIAALKRLYARTLWFWICVVALWTILY